MGHGNRHDDEPRDGDDHDDDEHDEPVRAGGGPPHPLDRLWLHPSELPVGPAPAPPVRTATGSPRWFAPMVAGVAGALATIAILAATGTLDRSAPIAAPSASPDTTATPTRAIANASALALSMVFVTARDGTETRRGSGVCVRHGGEVLTSASVVGEATRVDVVTSDGQQHRARVVGRDRTTDLVLLAIDATVPAAQLAPHRPAPGAPVWIVGAPPAGGSAPWMSSGMLSSVDAVVTARGGPWTGGLLETDAASGPQTSGAALVDTSGMVAGIVLGRLNAGDTTYVVPIDEATRVSAELHDHGVAKHGSLGFDGVDALAGPTVTKVAPHGPSASAGVHTGDVVQSVDGRAVESVADVMALVRGNQPGTKVMLELRRGRHAFKVQVALGSVSG